MSVAIIKECGNFGFYIRKWGSSVGRERALSSTSIVPNGLPDSQRLDDGGFLLLDVSCLAGFRSFRFPDFAAGKSNADINFGSGSNTDVKSSINDFCFARSI